MAQALVAGVAVRHSNLMAEEKTTQEVTEYDPIAELKTIVAIADQVSGPGITGQVHRDIMEKAAKLEQYMNALRSSFEAAAAKVPRKGRPHGSKNKKKGNGVKVSTPAVMEQPAAG